MELIFALTFKLIKILNFRTKTKEMYPFPILKHILNLLVKQKMNLDVWNPYAKKIWTKTLTEIKSFSSSCLKLEGIFVFFFVLRKMHLWIILLLYNNKIMEDKTIVLWRGTLVQINLKVSPESMLEIMSSMFLRTMGVMEEEWFCLLSRKERILTSF